MPTLLDTIWLVACIASGTFIGAISALVCFVLWVERNDPVDEG